MSDRDRLLRLIVERSFPVEVLPFCIPWDAACSPGTCLMEAAPFGRAARGYIELAQEVLGDG